MFIVYLRSFFYLLLINLSFLSIVFAQTKGPQFEGWYTRIVDSNSESSIAIIGGSFLGKDEIFDPNAMLPGYLAILISKGNNSPMTVYEAFPKQTYFFSDGGAIMGKADYTNDSTFEWVAPEYGTITNKFIKIEIPGKIKVKASFSGFLPFPSSKHVFGIMKKIKTPIRWHVFSMGSQADYEIQYDANDFQKAISGKGYAHQEKNWGLAFPSAWMWIQGISKNNIAQIVLSGGVVAFTKHIKLKTWVLGFKTPEINWDFKPFALGTSYKTEIDPCNSKFIFVAQDLKRKLVLRASAPKKSFSRVAIPTKHGFKADGAIESFSATISIKAYKRNLFDEDQLIETKSFNNAALEFGGDYINCPSYDSTFSKLK